MLYLINKYCFIIIISIDYCNSWSFWYASNKPKANPVYNSNLYETKESYGSFNNQMIKVTENVNRYETSFTSIAAPPPPPPPPPPADDTHAIARTTDTTWVDLAISLSSLAFPYIPDSMQRMNIDWNKAKLTLRVFEASVNSFVEGRESYATIAREFLPAAAPLLFDVTGKVVEAVLEMMEISESHSITRRSARVRGEVAENVMKAFESIIYFMTGYDVTGYRDLGDL